MNIICKNCGNRSEVKKGWTNRKNGKGKKFCSFTCQTRYNARKRNRRLKDDPEFKRKSKERFKKWYSKPENYARYKEYMKLYMRKKFGYKPRL